ncbi:GGDEF domain-containing protein [Vibrio comitans]|nr:GGDEF domain-containing protein [Vibrio comitans]
MNYLWIAISALFPAYLFFSFQILDKTDFLLESASFILLTTIYLFGRTTLEYTVKLGLLSLMICESYEFLEEVYQFQSFINSNALVDIFVGDVLALLGLALIAYGIHNMFRRQRRMAEIEPLTNTFNKRAIEQLSKKELERSLRYMTETSMILVDIDHFKQVNDVYGHQVGDRVLVIVAEHLRKQIRGYDLLARWGGDEFIILCPSTSQSEVEEVMTRLQKSLPLPIQDAHFDVTLSIGGTTVLPMAENQFERLFFQADKALYKVKNNGRNNRCHFHDLSYDL